MAEQVAPHQDQVIGVDESEAQIRVAQRIAKEQRLF